MNVRLRRKELQRIERENQVRLRVSSLRRTGEACVAHTQRVYYFRPRGAVPGHALTSHQPPTPLPRYAVSLDPFNAHEGSILCAAASGQCAPSKGVDAPPVSLCFWAPRVRRSRCLCPHPPDVCAA